MRLLISLLIIQAVFFIVIFTILFFLEKRVGVNKQDINDLQIELSSMTDIKKNIEELKKRDEILIQDLEDIKQELDNDREKKENESMKNELRIVEKPYYYQ